MPLVSYVQISTASMDGAGMVPTRCTIPDSTEEASSKAESGIAKKTIDISTSKYREEISFQFVLRKHDNNKNTQKTQKTQQITTTTTKRVASIVSM